MIISSPDELWKGLTDLPIVLMAGLFFILLRKRGFDKVRQSMFLYIFIAALLGALAHSFSLARPFHIAVWLVLFALLFEIVRAYAEIVRELAGLDARLPKPYIIAEAVLYIVTAVLTFVQFRIAIFVFVVFAVGLSVHLINIFRKNRKVFDEMKVPAMIIFVALILQALKNVIPGAIVIAHCIICVAMYFLYRMAEE